MKKMEELKEMLCEELEKITKKGELSAGSLDVIDKLTHSIKSIDTIIAMEDAGYSNDYSYGYSREDRYMMDGDNRGNSNARGRKRDSMGRYSRDNSYRDSYNRGGYSREDEMESLKMDLHEMLEEAKSEDQRRMIRNWIKQVEE